MTREAILMSRDPMHVNRAFGEDLEEIWWQGRQWAVTSWGIEKRDGTYEIQAKRLWERGLYGSAPKGPAPWAWPDHMSEKNWVDIHDFCSAFLVALSLHAKPAKARKFHQGEALESCGRAIKRARQYGHIAA